MVHGLREDAEVKYLFQQTISKVHDLSLMINKHLARVVFHSFPTAKSPSLPMLTFGSRVIITGGPHSEEDGVRQGLTSTFWSEECLNDVFEYFL